MTKSKPMPRFGVLIDDHAGRVDYGVPVFWDGWYDTRERALEAAHYFGNKSPTAVVYLIIKEKMVRDGKTTVIAVPLAR
jgi:hypothetical protein